MHTLLVLCAMVGADPIPPEPDLAKVEQIRLGQIRQSIEMIDTLKHRVFAEVDKGDLIRTELLTQATKCSDGKITTYEQLIAATGGEHPQSGWDKAKGLITFTNVMWIFGAFFIGCAVIWLGGLYFAMLIIAIPAQVWEVILWVSLSVATWGVQSIDPSWQLAMLMPLAVFFYGAITLTYYLHGSRNSDFSVPFLMATVVWGIIAVCYDSHTIGFMAVGALLSALGFLAGHTPMCVMIGFKDDDAVPRATIAAGVLLALHIGLVSAGINAPQISVFREGMLFMGAFVYYLGMLILSSKYYGEWNVVRDPGNYWIMQIATFVSGFAAFYFGTILEIGTLLGIGGTFFCIYLLEKYYELPWSGKGWAWSLLGLGGILYGFGTLAKTYPQYFLFMG